MRFREPSSLIWSSFDLPRVNVAGWGDVGLITRGLWSWKICDCAKTWMISGARFTFVVWISRFTSFSWIFALKRKKLINFLPHFHEASKTLPVHGNIPLQSCWLRRNRLIVILWSFAEWRRVSVLLIRFVFSRIVICCEGKNVFIAKSILTLKVIKTAVRGELVARVNCLSDDLVHKSQLIDLKYFCSRYGNFANENVYLPKQLANQFFD